jgi:hypothetical protein
MKSFISSAVLIVAAGIALAGCSATNEVTPVKVSQSEAEQVTKQQQDAARATLLQAYPDALIPEASRVRFVTATEKPYVTSECLNENGFDTDVQFGGVGGVIPEEQMETYKIAQYVCDVQYPVDPIYSQELSEDQRGSLYDYYADKATPCLKDLGYEISDPPSRDVFIEKYSTGVWNPYDAVNASSTNEKYEEAIAKCPPYPDVLFGG